jgi:hypothetical protein
MKKPTPATRMSDYGADDKSEWQLLVLRVLIFDAFVKEEVAPRHSHLGRR